MFEATGNDAYARTWWSDLTYNGSPVNASVLVDGGDLDGDGRREFLAGGLKPLVLPGDALLLVIQVLESTADDSFEVVASFVQPYGTNESSSLADVADVDGDGRKEVIIGSGKTLRVYRNAGDNAWTEWGSTTVLTAVQSRDAALP